MDDMLSVVMVITIAVFCVGTLTGMILLVRHFIVHSIPDVTHQYCVVLTAQEERHKREMDATADRHKRELEDVYEQLGELIKQELRQVHITMEALRIDIVQSLPGRDR